MKMLNTEVTPPPPQKKIWKQQTTSYTQVQLERYQNTKKLMAQGVEWNYVVLRGSQCLDFVNMVMIQCPVKTLCHEVTGRGIFSKKLPTLNVTFFPVVNFYNSPFLNGTLTSRYFLVYRIYGLCSLFKQRSKTKHYYLVTSPVLTTAAKL